MAENSSRRVLQTCDFVLIRVAPDPIRHEFLNLGVALFQPGPGGFIGVRCNRDTRRMHCLFPHFEVDDLVGLEAELQAKLADPGQRDYFVSLAQETFSHALAVSAPTRVLTDDPASELNRLFELYAATPALAPPTERTLSPRRTVLQELELQFRQAAILEKLQRSVRMGEWLGDPDGYRADFFYKPNGTRHIIQALPLESDEGAIKTYCFTVGRIRASLNALDAVGVTTVGDPRDAARTRYHRDLLLNAGVRVLELSQIPEEAARIRVALNLA